jgi:hypothetical protein
MRLRSYKWLKMWGMGDGGYELVDELTRYAGHFVKSHPPVIHKITDEIIVLPS